MTTRVTITHDDPGYATQLAIKMLDPSTGLPLENAPVHNVAAGQSLTFFVTGAVSIEEEAIGVTKAPASAAPGDQG